MRAIRLYFIILFVSFSAVYSADNAAVPSGEKNNGWNVLPDINIMLYPALLSSFYETPSAESGLNNIIQGQFGTIFAEGSTDIQFLPWFTFHPAVHIGWIMPNTMYLDTAKTTTVTIGGYVIGFNADIGFRPLNDKNYYAEIRAGFVLNTGDKLFFDYTENGTVYKSGLAGNYHFFMFGPEFTLEGRWTFIPTIGLGLLASGYWSPSYENHSTVQNKDGTKSDFAPGSRWGTKVLITWNNPDILAALGWKYEKIYFTSDYSTHDLSIIYSGPIAQVTFLY